MNPLVTQIQQTIHRSGPMPFAEFMRRALYDPDHGYYSRAEGQTGRRGDFMTSVSVGSFFGELLAFQFARWLEAMPCRDLPARVVEVGAHDGNLARDILGAWPRAGVKREIEYWIVEPSPARCLAQRRNLEAFDNVRWFGDLAEIQARVHGVIFSNELLDALPVHPFVWNAAHRSWEELGVAVSGEQFVWARLGKATVSPPDLPGALLDVLPDGYTVETSPVAAQWWRDAAAALVRGRLLTIDYGGVLEELLSPGRNSGTLRAYSRHQVSASVLENPGKQDITAHVNFTDLRQAGETAGLRSESFTTQSQFLTAIAREFWAQTGFWPPEQVRQFQTLTHPEHLGRPFRVLVQSR